MNTENTEDLTIDDVTELLAGNSNTSGEVITNMPVVSSDVEKKNQKTLEARVKADTTDGLEDKLKETDDNGNYVYPRYFKLISISQPNEYYLSSNVNSLPVIVEFTSGLFASTDKNIVDSLLLHVQFCKDTNVVCPFVETTPTEHVALSSMQALRNNNGAVEDSDVDSLRQRNAELLDEIQKLQIKVTASA